MFLTIKKIFSFKKSHFLPTNISVVIPYYSNTIGLTTILLLLQQQTKRIKNITIIDSSKEQSAKMIVDYVRLPSTNVKIIANFEGNIYQAWNKGIKQSKKSDYLILNDDILIPLNFIEILSALKQKGHLCYVPTAAWKGARIENIDENFTWMTKTLQIKLTPTQWMKGFCFFLPEKTVEKVGLFDESFSIWFGDDDYQMRLLDYARKYNLEAIVEIFGCYVFHYGRKSYSKVVKKEFKTNVLKDKKKFEKKWKIKVNDFSIE